MQSGGALFTLHNGLKVCNLDLNCLDCSKVCLPSTAVRQSQRPRDLLAGLSTTPAPPLSPPCRLNRVRILHYEDLRDVGKKLEASVHSKQPKAGWGSQSHLCDEGSDDLEREGRPGRVPPSLWWPRLLHVLPFTLAPPQSRCHHDMGGRQQCTITANWKVSTWHIQVENEGKNKEDRDLRVDRHPASRRVKMPCKKWGGISESSSACGLLEVQKQLPPPKGRVKSVAKAEPTWSWKVKFCRHLEWQPSILHQRLGQILWRAHFSSSLSGKVRSLRKRPSNYRWL